MTVYLAENTTYIQGLFDNGFQTIQGATLKEHLALIDQIDTTGILQSDLKPHQITNLAQYFYNAPDVAMIYLWNAIGKSKISNLSAFLLTTVNNKTPANILCEIMTDNQRWSFVKENLNIP